MFQNQLMNSESFKKYRFGCKRQLSDLDIVCRGNLVESNRTPEKFHNGWYPIRQCSFHEQEPKPGAGLKIVNRLQFRNYRVLCDICDHPNNQLPPVKDTSSCCYSLLFKPHSVEDWAVHDGSKYSLDRQVLQKSCHKQNDGKRECMMKSRTENKKMFYKEPARNSDSKVTSHIGQERSNSITRYSVQAADTAQQTESKKNM